MGRGARGSYWSHSKFANWVLRTFTDIKRPNSATMKEWRQWKVDFQTRFPWTCWFVEDFLGDAQDVAMWASDKLDDLRYWGYNRFVSRPHLLKTQLKPGNYYDVDTRMLHGLFETLVDFVEIEKAWHHVVWNRAEWDKYHVPWYKRVPYWMRWKEWRCPEAGIAHLIWEMSLINDYYWLPEEERASQPGFGDETPQALAAHEQYELYHWWKNVRPTRPDPMDAGGWSAYCEYAKNKYGAGWIGLDEDNTDEENRMSKEALDKTHEIEAAYEAEDEEMLIRLIKIRRSLWT